MVAINHVSMILVPATTDVSFFLQAEDGIRVLYVTGVQTCALPIYRARWPPARARGADARGRARHAVPDPVPERGGDRLAVRSEERRVGKESKSRWWSYHLKKKRMLVIDMASAVLDGTA